MISLRIPFLAQDQNGADLLGTQLTATSHQDILESLARWIPERTSRYLCFCSVHMIMEGYDDPSFRQIVSAADVVAPDGRPLVWYLRRHGFPEQTQVTGPELMAKALEEAAEKGWKIGLIGGEDETLELLKQKTFERHPNIQIVYSYSPPFRALSVEEDQVICEDIGSAGVEILFVGLGCPKQERWMADHVGKLNCVMLGVGAAFKFNSGQVRKAPEWIQRTGMEWFFRMCMEPRRLWKRYARHNPRFVALMLRESLFGRAIQEAPLGQELS